MLYVAGVLGLDEVSINSRNYDLLIEKTNNIADVVKETIEGVRLDRHKIMSVITMAILYYELITIKSTTPNHRTFYANEVFTLNLISRILYDGLIKEFCKIHKAPVLAVSSRFPSFEYPKPSKDELPVEKCLLSTLSFFKDFIQVLKCNNMDFRYITMGCSSLISHIYYYYEKYNWDLWHDAFRSPPRPLP
jgi:hypothetical protein